MTHRTPELRLASSRPNAAAATPSPTDWRAGELLVRGRGIAGLREALAAAPPAPSGGWAEFWRGYAAQFDDLAIARLHWLAAEEFFERDADQQGLDLVACGLTQCVLLDCQTYQGFEARTQRVAAMPPAHDPQSPCGLFQSAARVLVAGEFSRQAVDGVSGDIEQVFMALGQGLDAEIRLRAATAVLSMLGLALDRVRTEDFCHAVEGLAASMRFGDYSRALWHLFLVESRFYDASWVRRLHTELDSVERLARSAGTPKLVARAHILRAALALGDGDVAVGRASLDAAHRLLDPAHPADYWAFHYFSSRHALMAGETDEALAHATLSRRKLTEAGVPPARSTPLTMQDGYVLTALGRLDDAEAAFASAAELSRGAQATPCLCHVHLTRAQQHLRDGAHGEARAELAAGFAQARSIELTHFFRALPRVAADLCGAALELDADPAFARKVIAVRSLACPDRGIAQWPWPLRVRTFGAFAIERDGEVFRFGRKAPKRMLDMLRLVTALGGRQVDTGRVASALWSDAEGDEARDALKAMLHRARALLGPDLLAVRDGQISFDEHAVWLDTWALEHVCGRIESLLLGGAGAQHVDDGELERRRLQLMSLYRGHFLGEGETPAWAIAVQDRWRERFVRSVVLLGQRAERVGRPEAAIALYRAGLEQDNLAEEIYQRLIECHIVRGESAQALNAYRRCRELLSIVLGLRPSARTEALVARIPGR